MLGKGEWALKFNCNFLLNTGLMGNGLIPDGERFVLEGIGKWISVNKSFIYNSCGTDILADNADIFYDGEFYYAVIKKVPMRTNANVASADNNKVVTIKTDKKIVFARWLDNGKSIKVINKNSFFIEPFSYGYSFRARVAKFKLKKL